MKTPLIFKIHNPNPVDMTAERILPILLKSNSDKVESVLSTRGKIA